MKAAVAEADLLTPAEADWPPELRLPPPPPPPPAEPPPASAVGMDDSQFLGSIMVGAARQGAAEPPPQQGAVDAAPVGAKKKRGRPPKKRDGAAVLVTPAKPAKRREDEEEVVCFICFDGGNLVVCDRRGCPKVYHPACIKRDEAFFQSRSKWNCGWHICSSCEKAVHYMCYTCTYSLCKVCIKQGKFFSVRGTKGFCDTCFGTILLIESKDEGSIKVDFDDINSWEYLFKLYWLDLKGKLSLTMEELTSAKNRWSVPNTSARKEKDESSDDLYDINNDDDAGSDCSSGKRRRTNSSRKKGRKRQKVTSDCSIPTKKVKLTIRDAGSLPVKVPSEGVSLPVDTNWASPELLEFVGHMRDGDRSFISQFDVQTLLLEYIKKNNLRDPQRKSQIVCDARLHRLFWKTRVAHFEMLKLLEMHFLISETSRVNNDSQGAIDLNSAQIDTNGYSDMAAKLCPDKKRRMHRKMEREPQQVNLEDYAAVDMHNINLIYIRRSLMEDLIDDATFLDKIHGGFVRIKISGVGQKQDMYRLVKVIGTHKVPEKYSIGKKMTNLALVILNLDKKEIITMDTISNQDFTEEECKRLRQSMKCGLISRLKVGDVQEEAKILQSVRVSDWLENEKQRLEHLRDRASETGCRKELRECVEKLQLLNNSEERTRRINEVLEVHVDSHMDPNYESAEEMDCEKAVGRNVNWKRSDTPLSRKKSKYPNTSQNHTKKISDSSHHPKKLSMDGTIRGPRAGRKFENFHSTNGTDIPKSSTKASSTMYEGGSLSSSGVTMSSDTEPEKVWHYKDPSGNVQGPFTLLQLSKWTSYFPRDLRIWLTFESEERSLLLTEVLSKQQKDFTQAASVTTSSKAAGTGGNVNSPSVDQTNTLSPVGYSMLNSSGITVQSNKYSVPERESVNSPDDSFSLSTSSVPPKDTHTLNCKVQCQTKHSAFFQSPGSPYGQTDLHHDGVQGGCSGESNHRHISGALWSPTTAQMSCNGQGNVESQHNQHVSWSQSQHDSKNRSRGGSVEDLNSRQDLLKNLPTQRVGKDVPSPVFAWSPSESRTASSQHEGSCLSSTANPRFLDELHSSIASAKSKSCASATPIEDRGSSSPSDMLSHSERVPICSPQSAPSASACDTGKMEEIMDQQRSFEADTSNASVDQSPQSKIFPVSSPDNQDIDREFPSPTPRSENKEPAIDNSGLKPASPENSTATHSPVSGTCKMEIMNQQNILNADASNSPANHSQSKVFPIPSNNKDLEREYPSSTPRSENKEPAVDSSLLTSAAPENLTMTSASVSDTCKMEEILNERQAPEADASNASLNQLPHSNVFPESSPDNHDIEREYHSPTPRSENKEPVARNSGLTSAAPENLTSTSAAASDTCKMEENTPENLSSTSAAASDTCKMEENMYQQETFEVDASNASPNQLPRSNVFPVSSPDNENIEHDHHSPTPKSENKEPLVDNSGFTSAAPENLTSTSAAASDTCKMEDVMNQQKTLEADASNASPDQLPRSNIFLVSSDNENIEHDYHSPTRKSENKEPLVDNSGLTSAAPENLTSTSAAASYACKMDEIMTKQKTLEADAPNASPNQLSCSNIFPVSSPDNENIERDYHSPTRKSENKEPLVDNPGLTSAASENLTTTSASASDTCKMEESVKQQKRLEADTSNGSVIQSPQSKIFLLSSPDILGIEREFTIPATRSENKEPVADNSGLTSAEPETLTTDIHGDSPDAFVLQKFGPPTEELGAGESDLKGKEEIFQKELYSESTIVTRENIVIDPSCGAESIDVSDVLESLIEERCGTSYMNGTTALEDFLAPSVEEEPQCSSPIALSPWGEPSYYQGDAVDSALWGVQDDPINDMWSLLSPTPMLQPSSGIETEGNDTHDINGVAVSHGNNEIFQRGPMPREENVSQANSGAATDWVLQEQVKSKPNDMSISSVAESTGVVAWQPSANQSLNAGTAWSTSQNLYLSSGEKAPPSSNSSWEASRKQEYAASSVSCSGDAIGNINKGCNPVNANRGSQRRHHRDRYSQISESWLLSSNHTRSRSDRFGCGGSSRSTSKGQTRGVCKFHESGHCRKGASCSYLHP